jgi:hypothetical protein
MKGITPKDESVAVNPHPNPPPCTGEGTFRADAENAEIKHETDGDFARPTAHAILRRVS